MPYVLCNREATNHGRSSYSPWQMAWMWGYDPTYDAHVYAVLDGVEREIERAHRVELVFRQSAPSDWSVAVTDEDGTYNPDAPGTWQGVMGDRAHGQDPLAYRRQMILRSIVGGIDRSWTGVPTGNGYHKSAESRKYDFVWQGTDVGLNLWRSDQNLASIRSTAASPVLANGRISNICGTYGVVLGTGLGADDYTVRLLNPNRGKPITAIEQLLEAKQLEWTCARGYLQLYWPLDSTSAFTYNHSTCNVYDVQQSASSATEIYDQAYGQRVVEASKKLAEKTVTTFANDVAVPLGGVRNSVSYRISSESNGKFVAVRMLDAGGTVITGGANAGTFDGVASIKFNWAPPNDQYQDATGTYSSGTIEIFGADPDSYSTWESQFEYTSPSQAAVINKRELGALETLWNYTDLQTWVTRWLQRNNRSSRMVTLTVPLNPIVYPGMAVREINMEIRVQRVLHVVEARHVFTQDPAQRRSVLSCVEYTL